MGRKIDRVCVAEAHQLGPFGSDRIENLLKGRQMLENADLDATDLTRARFVLIRGGGRLQHSAEN